MDFLQIFNPFVDKSPIQLSPLVQEMSGKPSEMSGIIAPQPLFIPPSIVVNSERRLQPALEKKIDTYLTENSLSEFYTAIQKKDGNLLTALAAEALTGMKVREATNNNDGEMVELIQKTAGGMKGYPWCMYEQQTCVAYAERKLGIVSKLPCSGSCAEIRRVTKAVSPSIILDYKASHRGCLWIWSHPSGNGHAGNFSKWITKFVTAELDEGNTTAGKLGDKIVREGGGSYRTQRKVELSPDSNMRLAMVIETFPLVGG